MNWDTLLITWYLTVCKHYQAHLQIECQRFTNGGYRGFSDEEAMVIYLFGISRGLTSVKSIYSYTQAHLASWFPTLPSYAAFVNRLHRLSNAFCGLINVLQDLRPGSDDDEGVYLVDSFPISLAHHQHAYTARIAPDLATRGYNATKKQYYYGVKAHVVARSRPGQLPELKLLMLAPASQQDGPVFDQLRPWLRDALVIGDNAYRRPDAQAVEKTHHLTVITPIAKQPGRTLTPEQRAFSKRVSTRRQPIEALIAWLDRKTCIQQAQRVRSTAGLLVHIFGRLAAAMLMRNDERALV